MYTQTIMAGQHFMSEAYINEFEEQLTTYQELTEHGYVQWVNLQEAVDIWETQCDSYGGICSTTERMSVHRRKTADSPGCFSSRLAIGSCPLNTENSTCYTAFEIQQHATCPCLFPHDRRPSRTGRQKLRSPFP